MAPRPIMLPPTDKSPEEIAMAIMRPRRANDPAGQRSGEAGQAQPEAGRESVRLLQQADIDAIQRGEMPFLRAEEDESEPED